MHAAGIRLDRKLGDRVFNATVRGTAAQLPVGISPLNDLRSLRGFLTSPASIAMMDAPISLLFIVIIFAMSVPLGAMVLVAAHRHAGGRLRHRAQDQAADHEAQKLAQEAQRYATTTLKNAQVIQAMGMMGNIRDRWLARQRKFIAKQAEASDHAGDGAAISKFIQVAQSSMVLGFAAWLLLIGELDAGGSVMIVAWILSSRALGPLQQLIAQWKSVVGARDTYARLDRLLERSRRAKPGWRCRRRRARCRSRGLIAAAPGTQVPILRGVNFALAPGRSAGGGRTFGVRQVDAGPPAGGPLARASGKVRLDGVDVYAWNKQELGPHVGYLPQDNELFDGSLAENIARFGDVDPDKVEAAARAVGLHDMVERAPRRLRHADRAGGSVLSGGQRQRVALARAIYNDPQFIVLDEPNSSLDEAGERALVQTLLALKSRGATLVIITHRTSVLEAVDRMLVLRDGQMQTFGPRDDVLAALAGKPKPAPAAAPALAAT